MHWMRWLGGFCVIAALGSGIAAARRPGAASKPQTPVGTWKLVTAKANGKAVDIPAGTTVLKHVTPTDFVFVYYTQQGLITVAGGGHYTYDGTRYAESVEYGVGEGMAPYIGKTQAFTLRIADGRWYQSGTETDGTAVEEVWELARSAQHPADH
ncbi:MAG TPA: hypothetical protein VKB63_02935 [Gemmatimonadales bacterium]|nr:hypothetical protein [Gemmatimonadales bacterium]